jgi:Cof subfamily protein (haloacid dehalogenase superfamily)
MNQNPYKMIAIDLDGTLLSPDGSITPRVVKAIERAVQSGLRICFATGRNYTECRTILQTVNHYDTAVFVGGAVVMDTRQRVTIHKTLMGEQLAAEVAEYLESMDQVVLALQEHEASEVDYLITDERHLNEPTRLWLEMNRKVRKVPSVARHSHRHTMRLSICAHPEDVAKLEVQLRNRFGERILCHALKVTAYDVEVLEVFDPAVNKWQGILKVAQKYGILPQQIVAVGDDVNDLPMIKNAALGVAMGNAHSDVKTAAKRVIGSNHQDGLAEFLEMLVDSHTIQPCSDNDNDAAA